MSIHTITDWGICPYCNGLVKLKSVMDDCTGKIIPGGKFYNGYFYHNYCLEKVKNLVVNESQTQEEKLENRRRVKKSSVV